MYTYNSEKKCHKFIQLLNIQTERSAYEYNIKIGALYNNLSSHQHDYFELISNPLYLYKDVTT